MNICLRRAQHAFFAVLQESLPLCIASPSVTLNTMSILYAYVYIPAGHCYLSGLQRHSRSRFSSEDDSFSSPQI